VVKPPHVARPAQPSRPNRLSDIRRRAVLVSLRAVFDELTGSLHS
jgi:hypothetical protein